MLECLSPLSLSISTTAVDGSGSVTFGWRARSCHCGHIAKGFTQQWRRWRQKVRCRQRQHSSHQKSGRSERGRESFIAPHPPHTPGSLQTMVHSMECPLLQLRIVPMCARDPSNHMNKERPIKLGGVRMQSVDDDGAPTQRRHHHRRRQR